MRHEKPYIEMKDIMRCHNRRKRDTVIVLALLLSVFLAFTSGTTHGGDVNITYTYDNLNRLTAVNYGNGYNEVHAYDAAGNRWSLTTRFQAIVINSDVSYTNSLAVTLTLSCPDSGGCTQMQLSNDNTNWSQTQSYSTTKSWNLLPPDEEKTVYVKFFKEGAGWSNPYSDSIILDTSAPVTLPSIPGGSFISAQSITLDAGSGAAIYYTTDGTDPVTSGTRISYTLPFSINTTATLKYYAVDTAGNSESVKTATYTILAHAEGVIQLPRTGQTKCYDTAGVELTSCAGTGQDGELQKGVAWPDPRFTSGTGTEADCMIDNLTGLMWPKNGNLADVTMTWSDALGYPRALTTLCGHSDWRLPNINELESFANAGQADSAAWLNTQGFTNVQSNYYWSSTTYAGNTDSAWSVAMMDGGVTYGNKGPAYYVWPVRAGQGGSSGHSAVWKTGQTKCYNGLGAETACAGTGQDGDSKRGVSWPSPRFIDYHNGEVTDNLTGLVWTNNANAPGPPACNPDAAETWHKKTWQGALDYVQCLNANSYLGHNDWRLPNKKELHSLSDYSQYQPALPSGHPFTGVSNEYWSSTADADCAWGVDMLDGYVNSCYSKDDKYYIWPVRAGFTISINANASYTNALAVTLTLSCSNSGSGCSEMQFSNDNTNWSASETYATTKAWDLLSGEGTKTVYVKFKDNEGIWSGSYSDTITYAIISAVNLPKTGQTKCYDTAGVELASCAGTGQDGELQNGLTWPNPRFTSGAGDEAECMIDNMTGLMWPKNGNLPNGQKLWNDAVDYPRTLTLCGHSDWRLPNLNELESLVVAPQSGPAAWLNTQGFTNVQTSYYWSSTTYAYSTNSSAWYVNMGSGRVYSQSKSSSPSYVWPVRAGQGGSSGPSAVWQTGQTTSYRTGDDGDLKQGVSWPDPRFTDHNNGEVTDNLTGLTWTKDTNPWGLFDCSPEVEKTWQGALDYMKCLNTWNYLGHSDWRLPNWKELVSLANYSKTVPALPSGDPFTNVQPLYYDYYWSSTTAAGDTVSAWSVDLWYGRMVSDGKSGFGYAWPVRAGQFYDLVISKSGAGVVTSSPAGIDCGQTCSAAFSTGAIVTLTLTPTSGSTFAVWSGGGCTGMETCTVTMGTGKAITATFVATGDLNADGKTDLADAIIAIQVMSNIMPAQNFYRQAEVNGDLKVGLPEAIYIMQQIAGVR